MEKYTDEELLLELINRNVMRRAPTKTVRCVDYLNVSISIGNDEVAYITFPKEAFGALCDLVYKPLGNSEQLESDEMDVIWRADDTVLSSHIDRPSIKGRVLWHDEHIEITDLDGFDDTFMIASVTNPERYVFVTDKQLKQCRKAVKQRKPEIKACPYCGSPKFGCKVFSGEVSGMGMKSWIECVDECGYQGAYCDTDEEAIERHNLIADNALPRNDAREE